MSFAKNYFDNKDIDGLKSTITPNWESTESHLALLDPPYCERVLEVGCGIGRMGQAVCDLDSVREYVGVDASEAMIREACNYCTNSKAEFYMVDGTGNLNCIDGEFDWAFCWLVFQHIEDDDAVQLYFNSVCDLLKPGCVFTWQSLWDNEKPDNPLWVWRSAREFRMIALVAGFSSTVIERSGRWMIGRSEV